jgi:predicted PurR-regulated permease PerM
MVGVDARTFRVVWTIFLFALLLATMYEIRETLILLAVSIFVAYMVAPLVNLAERFTHKRRWIALVVVYVVLVGGLVTIGINLGSQIADEASSLFSRLPKLLQGGSLQSLPLPSWLEPLRAHILAVMQREASQLQASLLPLLQRASGHIVSGIGVILLMVLVPIISFFLLKDAPEINQGLIEVLREVDQRHVFSQIFDDIHNLLSNYIRALVLLAIISFAAWAIFLFAVHSPYPLLLAAISGALEFIPAVGPAVALATVVIVTGVSGFASGLLWVIVFWISFRLFQDYVLSPILMSAGVQIHPLLVLLGVLAGGQIGGLPGLFFSVPVIAILKVLFVRVREAQIRARLSRPASLSPIKNS